ncbi:MAG TPA: TonB-dependent receptor [Terriglobales bacterium]|nr:TonB-dependent receptor [Terriglobales bacterium]
MVFVFATLLNATEKTFSGQVVDTSGAAIEGARVELQCGAVSRSAMTDASGEFVFAKPKAPDCSLSIEAQGFATQTISAHSGSKIALQPLSAQQSITVTATRTSLANSDLPITAEDMTQERLQTEPPLTIDDKLRQIPGFSLYRRSGSETANPTTQGVSLRGLGASGASRSLVLWDGIPLNDPFGGWVYWGRVPLASIEQIDVVEGGVSDLYGSEALGGVVNVRTDHALETAFAGESSYGNLNTPFGSFIGSLAKGRWGATFSGEALSTDGYIPVPPTLRGPVDTYANSDHRSGNLLLERQGKNLDVFLEGNLYGESRQNGTLLQVNQATIRQLRFGTDWNSARAGAFQFRVFGGTENLHQTFSSINTPRTVETLTVDQRVPVTEYGGSAQWSKVIGHHLLTAGFDELNVTGDTDELHYTSGKPSFYLISGGRQQTIGVFGEDLWQVTTRWLVTGALRFDSWLNEDASSLMTPLVGPASFLPFANRSQTAVSPRVGVTRIVNSRLSLYGSGYRSFRAPTLNELYRSFRVGNVVTNANQDLMAEHFTGGEFGARVQATDHVQLRATMYGGSLTNPVENVTLTSTPNLITRQRQNLGSVQIIGVELGGEARITQTILFQAAYQFTDATVSSDPSNPALVGKMEPLVPRNAMTFAATYANPRVLTLSVQGRSASTEYDDDQNTLPLDPYFDLGIYVSRNVRSGLQVFGASENLLNSTYTISRTPIVNLASPRTYRAGLRIEFGERGNK